MRCINKVTLLGNLGKNIAVRFTGNGTPVTDLSIATHTFHKDKEGKWIEKTEWHKIVAWGKLAEHCERSAKKGVLILVDGTIQYRKYVDKSGAEKERAEIVANEIRFLDTKRNEGTNYDNACVKKAAGAEELSQEPFSEEQ